MKFLPFLAIIVFLFTTCEKEIINQQDPRFYNDAFHGNIVGKVLQKQSGAEVFVSQEVLIASTAVNESDGTFRFENLEIGNYDLQIIAPNYRTYLHKNVKVEGAGTTYLGEIDLSTIPDLVADHYPQDDDEIVYNNRFSGLTVSVNFTQPMDRESVEQAFQTDPPSEGIFYWGKYTTAPSWYYFGAGNDGERGGLDPGATITTYSRISSFVYRVAQKDCFVDTLYNISLSTAAKDTAGNHLRFPLNFSFRTIQSESTINGIQTNPYHGDIDVDLISYSGIQVTFPRNMNQATTEAAMHISPQVDPVFIWPDYNKLTIYTGGVFMADTTYTITIDSTATDLDGNFLGHDFSFSFKTTGVGLQYTYPTRGQLFVDPGRDILLRFNTFMVKSSVQRAFSIEPAVNGYFEWGNGSSSADPSSITFVPWNGLQTNTKYTITIDQEAEDLFGSHLKEPYTFSFITRPE